MVPKSFVHNQGFGNYFNRMRQARVQWGDHLTLIALAEILKRPIQLVTASAGPQYVEDITPPPSIPQSEWGQTIVLAYFGELHYEGTIPA